MDHEETAGASLGSVLCTDNNDPAELELGFGIIAIHLFYVLTGLIYEEIFHQAFSSILTILTIGCRNSNNYFYANITGIFL